MGVSTAASTTASDKALEQASAASTASATPCWDTVAMGDMEDMDMLAVATPPFHLATPATDTITTCMVKHNPTVGILLNETRYNKNKLKHFVLIPWKLLYDIV